MIRVARAAAAAMAFAIALTSAAIAQAPPASAAADDAVSWSVQPADEKGPDGRSWIELALDPGEKVTEHLALRNLSKTSVTFAIKAADGYLTSTGRFNMLPSDKESVAAGTWVDNPESVEVAAGETEIVAFTVSVPENATPGDHPAGIAASVETVGPSGDGTTVSIESRVGFPIMTRVNGQLSPSLGVEPVSVQYNMSWNPFQPGQVVAVYELANDGNVRMQASPVVEAQGRTTSKDPDARPLELLPGETREVTASVPGVWPLFFTQVEVRIDPMLVTPDGEPQAATPILAQIGVWTIPVPQLLVLVGVVLLVVALVVGRRRSRRRVETLVAEAREAGRQEAAQ